MSGNALCQHCRLPIVTHKSLASLSANQLQAFKHGSGEQSSEQPTTVYGNPLEDASFIVLTESLNPLIRGQPGSVPTPTSSEMISRETDMLERLYDFIGAKTDIDLPLCNECAESVKKGLKTEYEDACRERDAYITFLNKVKDEPVAGSQEVTDLLKRIKKLEKESQDALSELRKAEAERESAERDLETARSEARELSSQQQEVYGARNDLELDVQKQIVETRRLEALAEYQETHLYRLQRTDVYNDVFCIGQDGNYGTINGLRLGRLRDKKVEWSEINAALGQALLLLATLVSRLGVKLPEYRLKPLGSMSRIEKLEIDPETGDVTKASSVDLYSSGDYPFERLLSHKRLDNGMTAYLDILKRVGQHVESYDPTLKLPYAIDDDKIGGYSIRLSRSSSNEQWTAACKYLLTNAKWILAYVISH